MTQTRRTFLNYLAAGTTMAVTTGKAGRAFAQAAPRVLVVGGGTGGCTAAKYLKLENPDLQVTVIEPFEQIYRCWGSNEVLTGHLDMDGITITHDALRQNYGIEFIYDSVVGNDPAAKTVTLAGGETVRYDRMIVSPGVGFIMDIVEGYDQAAADGPIPHAWKAGEQTRRLKAQIDAMPDNGLMVIAPPPNPYRCPPGPYERASLLTEYFTHEKPRAKIMILDIKNGFTKDQPFMLGWNRLYGFNIPIEKMSGMPADVRQHDVSGRLEWVSADNGGVITAMDPSAMTVTTAAGETIKADVINYIPPQRAADLAFTMDLVDGNWCPIIAETMESARHPFIHVIGDATIAGAMPKSGYSANTQAKIAAAQINRLLTGQDLIEPTWSNVCFSRVSNEYGVSIGDQYRLDRENNVIIKTEGSGGVSPLDATHAINRMEAFYQASWMANFAADCFE
jgi:sulfide dehydrogenase [flavocytochrome c] flavoprotein subunit